MFLNELAAAMRSGDENFMDSRLNAGVISRYGSTACRATVTSYVDPTAAFTVQATSPPTGYTYTAAGVTSVIPDTITVNVIFTQHGQGTPTTIHLSRTDAGTLTWYTDCRPPASG